MPGGGKKVGVEGGMGCEGVVGGGGSSVPDDDAAVEDPAELDLAAAEAAVWLLLKALVPPEPLLLPLLLLLPLPPPVALLLAADVEFERGDCDISADIGDITCCGRVNTVKLFRVSVHDFQVLYTILA